MDANLIVIDDDAELARARALVEALWQSDAPADVARLRASAADRRLRGDPMGAPSRVSKVLRGKKGPSLAMVQRLRARFPIPADLLLPPPGKTGRAPAGERAA